MRDRLAITWTLDGEPVESETDLVRSGPYVLVLQTVLPQRGLAVELHSTFVGHAGVRTCATHLLLGPVGRPAQVVTREDESGIIDPVYRPDTCVYAHCHQLVDLLAGHGLQVAVAQLPARPVPLVEWRKRPHRGCSCVTVRGVRPRGGAPRGSVCLILDPPCSGVGSVRA